MKNITSILSFRIDPKCVSSNNGTQLYLCVIISFHYFVYLSNTIIYGQIINLLTFSTTMWRTLLPFWASALIPSACLLTMIQKLYFCMNYTFHFFYKSTFKSSADKQLITIRYNYVKNFTSILSWCIGPKCASSSNGTKGLSLGNNHFCRFFFISRLYNHVVDKQATY